MVAVSTVLVRLKLLPPAAAAAAEDDAPPAPPWWLLSLGAADGGPGGDGGGEKRRRRTVTCVVSAMEQDGKIKIGMFVLTTDACYPQKKNLLVKLCEIHVATTVRKQNETCEN